MDRIAALFSTKHTMMLGAVLFSSGLLFTNSAAQVTTSITSSGLNTQIGEPNTLLSGQVAHDITGGTRAGTNLFHSFGNFNVATNHIANFLNNTNQDTANILGRVNGGNPSNIFGALQTTGFGNANLFLMNPAGVVFGPNASLNVGGSVHVSTANYIRLADGNRFNAFSDSADTLLTSAPVAAFGFLGGNPAAIAIQGSQLSVPKGQTLSIVGGQQGFTDPTTGTSAPNGVSVTNSGQLLAPEGEINIVSVGRPESASGGEVVLHATDNAPAFSPQGFEQLGDVTLLGASNFSGVTNLDVSGNAGGSIVIRGGKLRFVNTRIVSDTGSGDGRNIVIAGKTVDISATHLFENELLRIGTAASFGGGEPGSLSISGEKSVYLTRIQIGSRTDGFAAFPSGPILINAPKIDVHGARFMVGGLPNEPAQLTFAGRAINLSRSTIGQTENFNPIDVRIAATDIATLEHVDMNLFTKTRGSRGSSIMITASDIKISHSALLTLSPDMSIAPTGPITLIAGNNVYLDQTQVSTAYSSEAGTGRPGPITIEGRNITLQDSTLRSTLDSEFTTEPSGSINIKAARTFKSRNSTLDVSGGSLFSKGGEINVKAGKLISLTESTLLAESSSASPAGTIHLKSGKSVRIKGSTLSVQNHGSGDAGTIRIQDGTGSPKPNPNQPNHDRPTRGDETDGNGDIRELRNDDQSEVVIQQDDSTNELPREELPTERDGQEPGDGLTVESPSTSDQDGAENNSNQRPSAPSPLKLVGDIRLQQSVLNAQSRVPGNDGQIVLEVGKRVKDTGTIITPAPIILLGGKAN